MSTWGGPRQVIYILERKEELPKVHIAQITWTLGSGGTVRSNPVNRGGSEVREKCEMHAVHYETKTFLR